jgi:hypothetical protein
MVVSTETTVVKEAELNPVESLFVDTATPEIRVVNGTSVVTGKSMTPVLVCSTVLQKKLNS